MAQSEVGLAACMQPICPAPDHRGSQHGYEVLVCAGLIGIASDGPEWRGMDRPEQAPPS